MLSIQLNYKKIMDFVDGVDIFKLIPMSGNATKSMTKKILGKVFIYTSVCKYIRQTRPCEE
jgi:hypothetical protein